MRLPSQELWTLLSSACEQASGIPKKILDDKAEELRIKNEAQKAIQVSSLPNVDSHKLAVVMGIQSLYHSISLPSWSLGYAMLFQSS